MRARSALASALCQPVSCGLHSRASCKITSCISVLHIHVAGVLRASLIGSMCFWDYIPHWLRRSVGS
jgi:hypothetical protein